MKVWRGQPENWTWKPSDADKAWLWLGFAGLFYVLSVVESISPSPSPATGRWAWLHNAATAALGAYGEAILFAILGTACVIASLFYFKASK